MSIRLRLTLLYTAILVFTLAAFGVMLFVVQFQATLGFEKEALSRITRRFATLRQLPGELPTRPFTSPDQYIQVRSPDGKEIYQIMGPGDVFLPLGNKGLEAVQSGEVWVEVASVEGERLLIRSVPIVVEGRLTEILQVANSLAVRDQSVAALGRGLLIGGLVVTVAAFGVGWLLAGVVLRPIQRMTQTAQAIGVERDFGRRVEHTGPDDEVGRLAKTFNAMLAQLQAAYRQVERALEMQRRFVADVSHELRTPLTTLHGNVELLRREPPISDEDRTEVLSDMVGESKRLIRLVNDLLTFAHAEARRPLARESIRIKPLIEQVCRQVRLFDPDRHIVHDPLLDVAVLGEMDALKQVLLILLDNALKHTDGMIAVTTQVVDERIAISVHDTGPGIEPKLLSHIFERFSRGKAGIGTNEGIGLGLAIAKALVEGQNGTLTVESQVGEGSVFTVALPQAI
jgi:signal transduction histidine kinase